ncbi:MAG: hypothetical protein U1E15_11750 [Hyphomicrobiales bacterium]
MRLPNTVREHELTPYLPQLTPSLFWIFPLSMTVSSIRCPGSCGWKVIQSELRATGNILPDQLQFMIGGHRHLQRAGGVLRWKTGNAPRARCRAYQRRLFRKAGEREVWSETPPGLLPWEEQPHAG